MLYIRNYKIVYLIIITVNLILRWRNDFGTVIDSVPYIINIGAVLINIITFILLEKGFVGAILIEKMISVIRMLVLLVIATLIFAGPIFLILPTSHVIWLPIIKYAPSAFYLWPFCLMFLILEVLFFIKLSNLSRPTTTAL